MRAGGKRRLGSSCLPTLASPACLCSLLLAGAGEASWWDASAVRVPADCCCCCCCPGSAPARVRTHARGCVVARLRSLSWASSWTLAKAPACDLVGEQRSCSVQSPAAGASCRRGEEPACFAAASSAPAAPAAAAAAAGCSSSSSTCSRSATVSASASPAAPASSSSSHSSCSSSCSAIRQQVGPESEHDKTPTREERGAGRFVHRSKTFLGGWKVAVEQKWAHGSVARPLSSRVARCQDG